MWMASQVKTLPLKHRCSEQAVIRHEHDQGKGSIDPRPATLRHGGDAVIPRAESPCITGRKGRRPETCWVRGRHQWLFLIVNGLSLTSASLEAEF
jgi:hypothetical protein